MAEPLTDLEKIRKLPYQVAATFLGNIFCVLTFMGSVFVLFLNELGLDKTRIGLVLALIPFSQLVAVFITPGVARIGYKKIFLIFYSIRKGVIMLLLATPWILSRYGLDIAYYWVLGVILLFSICRAVGESAFFPWTQEIIPNGIRGKFSAINSLISTFGFIGAISAAGFVISHYQAYKLNRFIWLITAGILVGIMSLLFYALMPGGKPSRDKLHDTAGFGPMLKVFKDRNYMRFLLGLGFATLALGALLSFVPLYMKEKVGLASGFVVWLDIGGYVGFMLFCYLWGWASDRYGSKPVMLTTLCLLVFMPPIWLLMPRGHAYSGIFAMAAAFMAGAANIGWAVTFARYLFVSAVPPAQKTVYMALFYAWAGLTAGTGPLLAGRLIDLFQSLSYQVGALHVDAYTPVFVMGFLFFLCAIVTLSKIHPDGAIPTQSFIGMFFQGNPVTAVANLMRYRWSGQEHERIMIAERLGRSGTLLSAEELIDALHDPSYNVRHAAINAISNMPSHPRLVDALIGFLGDTKSDLSLSAAYALGKLKDKSAIVPLQETLMSEYRLLRARSARALGMLGDAGSAPFIHSRMKCEEDQSLNIAYASALGALHYTEAQDDINTLLYNTENPTLRAELALALARLVGDEQLFIRLWRRLYLDSTTSAAQIVLSLRKELPSGQHRKHDIKSAISACATAFGAAQTTQAAEMLSALCDVLPIQPDLAIEKSVLAYCRKAIADFGATRLEYIGLLLHTMFISLRKSRQAAEHPTVGEQS